MMTTNTETEVPCGVWRHFQRVEEGKGRCNFCQKEIRTTGGNTTGLLRHLSSMHGVTIATKRKMVREQEVLFQGTVEPLDLVISRMAAKDGTPFLKFCTSEDIRAGLRARGFLNIDRSPNSIRNTILRYFGKVITDNINTYPFGLTRNSSLTFVHIIRLKRRSGMRSVY